MPTLAVTFEFQASRYDAPPITDAEFLAPLAISPGEVEAAWSWQEQWGGAGVRIVTARSEHPVGDAEFDRWTAAACRSVVRFFHGRPAGALDCLRAAGLVNLRLSADVLYVGEFPIVDFPAGVYSVCRELDIGFVSSWELPEEQRPAEPAAAAARGHE